MACSLIGQAQTIQISGQVPGAEGHSLRIVTNADLISARQLPLTKISISDNGHFSTQIKLEHTTQLFFKIGFQEGQMIAEPGQSYILNIGNFRQQDQVSGNPFLRNMALDIQIQNPEARKLNNQLAHFNHDYDQFVLDHFNQVYRSRNHRLVEDFEQSINEKYPAASGSYLETQIRYKIGSLKQAGQLAGRRTLITQYLNQSPVKHFHPEYMYFLRQIFSKYFILPPHSLNKSALIQCINRQTAQEPLMQLLQQDSTVRNPELRELIMIHALFEVRGHPKIKTAAIDQILQETAQSGAFLSNREYARSILQWTKERLVGFPAPKWELPDFKGQKHRLQDHKGAWLYLYFWSGSRKSCLDGLRILAQDFATKYSSQLLIIPICVDEIPPMDQINESHQLKHLSFDRNYELLERYRIKTFPSALLIDPSGKVIMAPAPTPGTALDREIEKLLEHQ